ncbi:serine/threonine-protein kinase pim-1-like [Pimephales promelas]|nr:serine/threonine-protein kinase pim-1-like [Pimephales promelas]
MANQSPRCRHIIKLLEWQDLSEQYIMVLERPSPCMDMHSFWLQSGGRFSEKLACHFMRQVIEAAVLSSYKNYSGTARYCPPEYFEKGKYHGKQATVWSLGVLLFAMIGRRFPDSRDIALMDPDVWFQPNLSDECCRFIRGCLKSDPKRRLHLESI